MTDWSYVRECWAAKSEVRRLDIAIDLPDAGRDLLRDLERAHAAGELDPPRGRRPVLRRLSSSDPAHGETYYVGQRGSDICLRCYEKGKQLAGGEPTALENWVRVELELRAETRELPWAWVGDASAMREVLRGHSSWVAGLLPEGEAGNPRQWQARERAAGWAPRIAAARRAVGRLVRDLRAYGFSDWDALFDPKLTVPELVQRVEACAALAEPF